MCGPGRKIQGAMFVAETKKLLDAEVFEVPCFFESVRVGEPQPQRGIAEGVDALAARKQRRESSGRAATDIFLRT